MSLRQRKSWEGEIANVVCFYLLQEFQEKRLKKTITKRTNSHTRRKNPTENQFHLFFFFKADYGEPTLGSGVGKTEGTVEAEY